MGCSLRAIILALVISGVLSGIIGVTMYILFPEVLDKKVKEQLVLSEDSKTYNFWKDVPVPIYIKFYFFNVTNPDEFYDLKKPVLEQLGPYTFREEREKVNITWNENGTVTYKQLKRWFFQPDKTVGSLSDSITTLNVPMIAAATTVQGMNQTFITFSMEQFFEDYDETWLVTKTVDEFLFKGYQDDLIDWARIFIDIPYDKFGWFYKRNNTDDGTFVIYTGAEGLSSLGEVYTWNDEESVSSYSPPCNMINGSAGDMWPPGLTDKEQPQIFVTDICRSLGFTYLKEEKINGIKTLRYWADETQLDNGKFDERNICFCTEECLPPGAVDVSKCKFDAPAVVSYPHFLYADSSYRDGVIGMRPNPIEHRMYLDIIPEMGVPLNVAARMQINIIFDKLDIKQFSNITRRTYFPMFWFSETAEAGPDITDQMKFLLVDLPLISEVVSFIAVGIGCFLVLFATVLTIKSICRKRQEENLTVTTASFVDDNGEIPKTELQDENIERTNCKKDGNGEIMKTENELSSGYNEVSSGSLK